MAGSTGESLDGGASGGRRSLPSIAVSPFFCIRHGTVQPGFGERLTVAVTEELKRFAELQVISASSSLAMSDRMHAELAQRSRSRRYIVSGHIVQDDQVISLNLRLRDHVADRTLFSGPVDVHLGDLHDVRQLVVSRVIAAVLPQLRQAEIDHALATAPQDQSSYEMLLDAVMAANSMTPAGRLRAELLLQKVVASGENLSLAYAWMARLHSIDIGQGWSKDRWASCRAALDLANRAIEIDPRNALALATAGHLNSYLLRQYSVALDLLRRAVEACPNEPLAWLFYSMTLTYVGRGDEARSCAEYALELSPFDPLAYMFHVYIAHACYVTDDFAGAERHCRHSIAENPNYSTTYRLLAVTLVALGCIEEARLAGATMLTLEPGYPAFAEERTPHQSAAVRALFLARLRTAGVLPPLARSDEIEPGPAKTCSQASSARVR